MKALNKADSNFWYLPARHSIPSKDSFYTALYEPLFYEALGEPNLGLASAETDIFRLSYSGVDDRNILIILTPKTITVKQRKTGKLVIYDEMRLTEQERDHINLLQINFPVHKSILEIGKRHYLDSMISVYPRLLDANYFAELCEKSTTPDTVPFTYTTKKINIAYPAFKTFVDSLNASGYWSFSYDLKWAKCSVGIITHLDGFTLEASTRKQYNIVKAVSCPRDSSTFIRACDMLVKLAGMEKEIQLIWGFPPAITD